MDPMMIATTTCNSLYDLGPGEYRKVQRSCCALYAPKRRYRCVAALDRLDVENHKLDYDSLGIDKKDMAS